jgi:DNA-binding HxlR family transcriptional regulator
MASPSDYNEHCTIARTLEIVGERWTLLILRQSFWGVKRFDQLQSSLGIARNILAKRLQTLVAAGILERHRYQDRPARYEYRLTERGRDLYPVVLALRKWGDRHATSHVGPPLTLVHKGCGKPMEGVMVCEHCGEPVTAHDVTTHVSDGLASSIAGP